MFNCLNESDWWFKFEFSAPRLQVVYQVGVLISRTSVSVVHIKHFWILAILQVSVCVVHISWILAILQVSVGVVHISWILGPYCR